MQTAIIALTTDFGTADSYVAQMKGVILGINPAARLVDVSHGVPPQRIAWGAGLLDDSVDAFPEGTIHLAVVDPGVGGDRPLVAVEMGAWRFVAPDNGLLSRVARRYPPRRVVRLTEPRFWRPAVSRTFHGRDVMAPVAAHWSTGLDAAEFGTASSAALVALPESSEAAPGDALAGVVERIDGFGNLITSIAASRLPAGDRRAIAVSCAGRVLRGVHDHYAQVEPGALIALIGSSGRLEISVRDGSAARVLNAAPNDPVTLTLTSAARGAERNDP